MMNRTFMKHVLFLILIYCFQPYAIGCAKVSKHNFVLRKSEGNTLEIKSLCDPYNFEVKLFDSSSSIILGEFISPYSQTMYVQKISSLDSAVAYLFTVDVAEPEPKGSYYFMVFNSDGLVHLSGYSDSLVYAKDIDNDGVEEVIIGSNTENIDPLELLVDYVPYPIVFDWEGRKRFELRPLTSYKLFFEKYLDKLATYNKVIKLKKIKR